jgi:putative hydrolase of the HAD superfamily
MLKAVVFDLGGTLLHYESATANLQELNKRGFAAFYRHLAARRRVAFSETTFLELAISHAIADRRSFRGSSIDTSLRSALARLNLSLSEVEWQAARRAFFRPIQEVVEPRQGARYTLKALRELGMALALLSNTFWPADLHDADLARFGLLDLLPIRLYSCDIGWLKPQPEAFRTALASLRVEPNEAVYVGDRLKVDIEPARKIGLWGVLIRLPFRDEQLEDSMPDAVISELPELVKILER